MMEPLIKKYLAVAVTDMYQKLTAHSRQFALPNNI